MTTLTSRESDILSLVASSYSCPEIAERLELSIRTVENHKHRAMKKLGVHDVAAVTRWALAKGLIRNEYDS